MSKKKQPKLKRKPRILKKTRAPFSRKKDSLRFKVLTAEFKRARNGLEKKVSKQVGELNIKNEQLAHEIKKLKLSEEQVYIFNQAVESTTDGIFLVDANEPVFSIIYANRSFQKMSGFSLHDLKGKRYFTLYGPEADQRIVEEIKESMCQGRFFSGEMSSYRKNGEKFYVLLRIAPMCDKDGALTHFLGLQTDISKTKLKESEIEEQREELLHVTRVGKLAEFVSSLAHEISQPLTAILSYAQAAQRMLAGREPQIQEILRYIVEDDQRATEVIRRLRSLLKKDRPEMKPLNINALINETVVLIATDAIVRNNVLKVELDTDLPFISGDRVQLQQVLLNLISNSFDAMEGNGQDSREILIRTSRKDTNTIIVSVKDSGCGVPAQNIPKLFNHFFTSKPDGLGMGLSISRSIIESHGGHLDVKNNPDRGVTFYFTIPVDIRDAQ